MLAPVRSTTTLDYLCVCPSAFNYNTGLLVCWPQCDQLQHCTTCVLAPVRPTSWGIIRFVCFYCRTRKRKVTYHQYTGFCICVPSHRIFMLWINCHIFSMTLPSYGCYVISRIFASTAAMIIDEREANALRAERFSPEEFFHDK